VIVPSGCGKSTYCAASNRIHDCNAQQPVQGQIPCTPPDNTESLIYLLTPAGGNPIWRAPAQSNMVVIPEAESLPKSIYENERRSPTATALRVRGIPPAWASVDKRSIRRFGAAAPLWVRSRPGSMILR